MIREQKANYETIIQVKDLKFSKYKEHACNRCRQIAEDLDGLDVSKEQNAANVMDVTEPKPKTVPDNQIPPKINNTNPITPSKDSPKVIGMLW